MADQVQGKDRNIDDQPPGPPPYSQGPPHGPPPGAAYGPPPGPHYGPPPGPQPGMTSVAVVPGAIVIQQTNQNIGPNPTPTTCRSCSQDMVTRIERNASWRTHLFAGLLCIIGCWPCVCIPYCMDSCLSTDHYCSNCGVFLGSYKR